MPESAHPVEARTGHILSVTGKNKNLLQERPLLSGHVMEFVGTSKEAIKIRSDITAISKAPFNALIQGESGTGKEFVATLIHQKSNRHNLPCVTLRCEELTPDSFKALLQNDRVAPQLFLPPSPTAGAADILLKNIDTLSSWAQRALISIIDREDRLSHIRWIATTRTPPGHLIRQGTLLKDLYYRLGVLRLHLPALRERKNDISALIRHFVYRELKYNHVMLRKDAIELLKNHRWPGNLRELRSYLINLLLKRKNNIICSGDLPHFYDFPEAPVENFNFQDITLMEATEKFQRTMILNLLDRCMGNKARASEILGISRTSIYRKLKHI